MLSWYAVHTYAAQEAKAAGEILKQGYRPANLLCSYERKHNHRVETVTAPLFRRYIFAEFDIDTDDWERIAYSKGVVSILGQRVDDRILPQPIRTGVIEDLLAGIEANGGAIPLKKPEIVPFTKGQTVRVLDGPWTGWRALVELDEGARVKVLLDLFGRSHVIPLARESIARG